MTFYDEDALKRAAQELGISIEELKESLKRQTVYGRYQKSNKAKRKEKRHTYKLIRDLEESKRKNPDWCFCEDDGLDVKRDYENDEVLGQITLHFGPHTPENAYEQDVYKCSRCGKKYIPPQPAWA